MEVVFILFHNITGMYKYLKKLLYYYIPSQVSTSNGRIFYTIIIHYRYVQVMEETFILLHSITGIYK